MNTKPQDWATHIVHDNRIEHWRVTGLLSKNTSALLDAIYEFDDSGDLLPEKVKIQMRILDRQLELTDYFLSGMGES